MFWRELEINIEFINWHLSDMCQDSGIAKHQVKSEELDVHVKWYNDQIFKYPTREQ